MKVTCLDCGAVYQIDDSKIPDKGAYAKCKKCQTRFFIKKESNLQREKITNQAVVKCNGCGKQISKNANFCPHCGEPSKTSKEAEIEPSKQETKEEIKPRPALVKTAQEENDYIVSKEVSRSGCTIFLILIGAIFLGFLFYGMGLPVAGLIVACLAVAFGSIFIKMVHYTVRCPYCGAENAISGYKTNIDSGKDMVGECSSCKKRIIIRNDKVVIPRHEMKKKVGEKAEKNQKLPHPPDRTVQARSPKNFSKTFVVVSGIVIVGMLGIMLWGWMVDRGLHGPVSKPKPAKVKTYIPQITQEIKSAAIDQIKGYPRVRDAAILQKGKNITLAIVVDYGTSKSYAKELGDNFVRMVKGLSEDKPPGKKIGKGIYNYTIGVFHPNEKRIAMGAKVTIADHISW